MNTRYLYIVLTRTNTVISRLISTFMNDEYTHAAISLDKELNHMYSFGRKYAYNPFLGRFKKEAVDEGVYRIQKEVPSTILEIEVSEQQYQRAQDLIKQFVSNNHLYKYNYKGLVHSLFNIEAYEDNRFLCSEFVYHILKESGVADFNISRNLVRPQKFLSLDSKVVYKGDLKYFGQKDTYYTTRESFGRGLSAVYE